VSARAPSSQNIDHWPVRAVHCCAVANRLNVIAVSRLSLTAYLMFHHTPAVHHSHCYIVIIVIIIIIIIIIYNVYCRKFANKSLAN